MSSTRPKLKLDEQSFQGLLSAAFTIQEHNDRRRAKLHSDPAAPVVAAPPPPAKSKVTSQTANPSQSSDTCTRCHARMPEDAATCAACGAEKLRPGEKLQRTWASMWLMSQEQGLWSTREGAEVDGVETPSIHRGPRPESSAASVVSSSAQPRVAFPKRFLEGPETGHPGVAARHRVEAESVQQNLADFEQGEIAWPEFTEESTSAAPSSDLDREVSDDRDHASQGTVLALSEAPESGLADMPDIGALADRKQTVTSPHSRLQDLLVNLSFRRADLYLGLAVLVAATALLWPTGKPRQHSLSTWDRTLIALGVADPPPTTTARYQGDPDIRVWVDTHAALYYCPGDEFYGKSPGGHYTTQREAQSERFEPAQRSACIQ